jgi:hypothetical protein
MHASVEFLRFLSTKENISTQSRAPYIMDFGKSEICPCFFYGSHVCSDSYKSMKHKYELLLGDHQTSESVEIVMLVIFYMTGMCPHLFLLKAYRCS